MNRTMCYLAALPIRRWSWPVRLAGFPATIEIRVAA